MSSNFSWSHDYISLLPESQRHLLNRTSPYRRIIAAALLTAILLLTYALGSGTGAGDASHATTPATQAEIEDATRPLFFSLLIPGGKKQDVETCRTVLSAQVLNYPIPQILPLDSPPSQPRDEGPLNEKGVAKEVLDMHSSSPAVLWVEAILKWLARSPPEGEDGIVLLLDEPGVYFQLRPQVLLQRYYRILTEADKSARAAQIQDVKKSVRHSIVFPMAKSCRLPSDEKDTTCDATTDPEPKALGEGYMMGPVKDIRQLLTRTLARLKQNPTASTHDIFTTLYREQLLHRQTPVDQSWFTFNPDPELGLTLDPTSLLSTSPSNTTSTPSTWNPLSPLPPEIRDSTPPYWTVFNSEPTLPHTATWSSTLLFFHPSSPTSPSPPPLLLPPPSHRTQTWTSLFYHPHARTLYTAAQHLPSAIVASIPIFSSAEGKTRLGERTFWNRRAKPDTAGAFNGGWKKKGGQVGDAWEEDFWPWRDMCGGEEEVEGVFGDGKGAWVGGRFY